MCNEDSDHLRGGCGDRGIVSDCDYRSGRSNNSDIRNDGDLVRTIRGTSGFSSRFRYFRLRSSLVLLIALITALSLLPHQSVCLDSTEENASVLISQKEVKTIEPTNNPTKVFVRRRIFRKLVKDPSASSNNSSSSIEEPTTTLPPPTTPQTLYSLVKRLNNTNKQRSSTVTGNSLKTSIQSSHSLMASKQKFNFQSLKTRLGLAAPTSTTASASQDSPTTPQPSNSSSNNLVMIPLPPNQRKPYTPVIMQVTKSTTSKPETKVQTFKLNKMFVPIGIYGKVVENETDSSSTTATEQSEAASSTPITSIRHRGTDTVGESTSNSNPKRERKVKGIAESIDLTYAKPDMKKISLTTERPDIGSISITTEANELFSSVFGSGGSRVSENDVRRGDQYNNGRYGGGGNKKPFSSNSGLTLMTPPALGSSDSPSSLADSLASYGSYSSYSSYNNNKNKYSPSSIVDSITDSMSRIPSLVPSLFHKGLTSLASMTSSMREDPFVDDNFSEASANGYKKNKPLISAPSSYTPKIPASVPGGYISGMSGSSGYGGSRDQTHAGSDVSSGGGGGSKKGSGTGLSASDMVEYETLEYFRKRPHLLAQLQQQQQQQQKYGGSNWRRSQGVRFSKGFKPANAPEHLAREYYKSTSTTVPSPEEEALLKTYHNIRRAKKMGRGSWLLRNSNEYVSNKNDKLVRMWKNLFESYSNDDPQQSPQQKAQDRMDKYEDNEDKRQESTLQSRRSSAQPQSQKQRNPVLTAHWSSIKSKYSKDQIDEAKERIMTLLHSGYGDEALLEHDGPGIDHEDELQHVLDYDTHMPPPPPPKIKQLSLTKGLSGAAAGAFKDLVKFFKLGVSVGTGQSREPVNYEQVVDEQEEQELGAVGGDWTPVVRRPLISFSAGISLKNPLSSKPHSSHHHHHGPPPPPHPHHHHHHHTSSYVEEVDLPPSTTHYSSSSSPYIPHSYKGLNHYIDELASTSTHSLPPTSASYSTASYEPEGPEELSPDYPSDDIAAHEPLPEEGEDGEYGVATSNHEAQAYANGAAAHLAYRDSPTAHLAYRDSVAEQLNYRDSPAAHQNYRDSEAEFSYDQYRTLKPLSKRPLKPSIHHHHQLDLDESNTDWNPVRPGGQSAASSSLNNVVYNPGLGSSSEYELVPSSVYLNGAHDPRDIAAVVKPSGVSDDMVRSVLPAGLRNLRILDYPKEYASLNSISQALGSDAGRTDASTRVSFKSAMKKLRENYVAKESAYLPGGESSLIGSTGGGGAAGIIDDGRLSSLGLGGYYNAPISSYYNQPLLQQQLLQTQAAYGSLGGLGGLGGLDIVGSGNVFSHANRINNNRGIISQYGGASLVGEHQLQQQQQQQQSGGKDQLGFTSNYNLPQNLDPDIAAILKSELDKDDIPEDVRQEFLEAKREEQKKQAAQQQQQAAYQNNRRVDIAQQTLIDSLLSSAKSAPTTTTAKPFTQPIQYTNPPQQQHYTQPTAPSMQSRAYHHNQPHRHPHQSNRHPLSSFSNNQHQHQQGPQGPPPPPFQQSVVTTRFFAPIPITPTLVTTALKNPRYASPVPRYVIELAKKLQKDKSVQGIVRVSAKRGRGLPPIEYLYPVKG